MVNISFIKDLDCTNIEIVKPYAYYICKNILEKSWKNSEINDFEIERLNGGQENYTYRCKLNIEFPTSDIIEVIFKIHGDTKRNDSHRLLKDNLVTSFMSNLKQGPQVFGIFDLGRVEQYFPCPSITQIEMMQPKYNAMVAREIARFHMLRMPFLKDTESYRNVYINSLDKILCQTFEDSVLAENHKEFINFDIKNELNRLHKFLKTLNSPIVFCHNDICFANILKLNEDKVMLIDYEDSSYNYRGLDIGSFFSGWMFNSVGHERYPHFTYNQNGFPSEEDQLCFVNGYIDEFRTLSQGTSLESLCEDLTVEKLLIEGKAFALLFHLVLAIWGKSNVGESKIKFGYKEWAIKRCEAYFYLKKLFFEKLY